jgi:large subunit ribosomal protein L9
VGEGGKIFGAVRERDVAEALSQKLGVGIEKHSVLLPAPIKTLGEHKVQVRIQGGLTAVVTINVISA